MKTQLWVGTTAGMALVDAPSLPLRVSGESYADGWRLESGGLVQRTAFGMPRRYDMLLPPTSPADYAFWRRLRQGSHGSRLIRFVDPEAYHTNLFSPAWAEPGLIETTDWPNIADEAPSFAGVSANTHAQPLRKATWAITADANTAPSLARSRFYIPIPPSMTLHLGASGAVTGTGVVHVQAINIAAGTTADSNLTLLTDTASTRLNASFAGSSYDYVVVDFRRTSSATSTVTVTSMLAQLWTTGVSPTLTGSHVPGEGNTGCRFDGNWDESYIVSGSRTVAFSLVEVGGWLAS